MFDLTRMAIGNNAFIHKWYGNRILPIVPEYPRALSSHIGRNNIGRIEYGYRPLFDKNRQPTPYHKDLFLWINEKVLGQNWKPGGKVMRRDEFRAKEGVFCPNCRGLVRAWTHSDMQYAVCDRCRAEIKKELNWKKDGRFRG